MTAPGWYAVDGDPAGTVRRWNGEQWIGFPVTDPTVLPSTSGLRRPTPMSRGLAALNLLTMAALSAVASLLAYAAIQVFGAADSMPPKESEAVITLSETSDYVNQFELLGVALLAAVPCTAIIFLIWLRSAAKTADLRRPQSQHAKTISMSGGSFWSSDATAATPLLIFWDGVRQIFSGLYRSVSETAMVSSIDPHTGVSQIGPIKIMIWWVLWWIPLLTGCALWSWVAMTAPIPTTTAQTVLQVTGVLLLCEVVSLLCLIVTIRQINKWLRRRG